MRQLLFIISSFLVLLVTSCKTHDTPIQEKNSIIIQLTDNAPIDTLETIFKKYDLKKQKLVSRPLHIYLYTFNPKKIENQALIIRLKKLPFVKEAQKNRTVKNRN